MRWPFKKEDRSVVSDWNSWFEKAFSLGAKTKSGQEVSPSVAMKNSAVYACVKVISETIASLPLFVYKRTPEGGKAPATEDYRFALLHDQPNPYQTSFEWLEMVGGHTCLRGNHISYILRSKGGKILALLPLNPANFTEFEIDPSTSRVVYTYTEPTTQKKTRYYRSELFHNKLFSEDGIWGLSPISQAREAIGLSLGTEEYAARFFANDARPGGILEMPGRISEDAAKRLKKQWDAAHAGSDKAHGTIVLEEGMTWSQVGMSNEDSQFLQSRGFEIEELARIWRVPCILIGHPNNTMTYASAEQFFLSFITHTIRPHLVRIEQALNLVLFDEEERKKLFCEFKLDGLLRGSTSERYAAYASALQNEWMCADEVRGLENLNPKPDGTGSLFKNPAINPMKSASPPDGGKNGA